MTRIGAQLPPAEHYHVPLFHSSLGEDAIALAQLAGLELDEWQQHVLECSLRFKEDGLFAAPDMTLIVPRQNGKGSVIEARELAGLFLLKESTIVHSAHEFKTAVEGHMRLTALVENSDYLRAEGNPKSTNSGAAGTIVKLQSKKYKLPDGSFPRVVFAARSKGSIRGFTVDALIMDEAYELPDAALDAMTPTMAAADNPQMWFISSTGMDDSDVLRRKRNNGMAKLDDLGYFEWKADDDCDPADRDQWYQSNPALGIRLKENKVAQEFRTLSPVGFARERLGLWASNDIDALIPATVWKTLEYQDHELESDEPGVGEPIGQVSVAVDVAPEGDSAAIYVAGQDKHGLFCVERADFLEGINWVPDALKSIQEKHKPKSIAIDVTSPAGALVPALNDLEVEYQALTLNDITSACQQFLTLVIESRLRHRRVVDDPELTKAVSMGIKRPIGHKGSWAWARKDIAANISPLVAATYALYAYQALEAKPKRVGKVF
ncbi:terminase large subunit [Gordonia phage Octobien14]|uniref:Terminase large subunit n=1 Tax=Gordonia phage Octobien14 TaxID=2483673 RepID=A0A3G3M9P1_9CAUD|nr:terminase large subunit [Gordonia phage Octobien14]AYR03161.1 terminase large subunit [Gordonia phage Octobien14]